MGEGLLSSTDTWNKTSSQDGPTIITRKSIAFTLICTERKLSSQDLLGLCFETILTSVESRSLAVRLVPRNRCEELGTCRKIRIRGMGSERK